MKRNVREPVFVLSNGIGLWRRYDDIGNATYIVRKSDTNEIEMTHANWKLVLSSMETDTWNEEEAERKARYKAIEPPSF